MKTQVKALKVKIKSLAAEARIIRLEEKRALGHRKPDAELFLSLRTHRINDVRGEQRAALLAYAYIRSKPYAACEKPGPYNPPDLNRVRQLVEKFGAAGVKQCKCQPAWLAAWVAGSTAEVATV